MMLDVYGLSHMSTKVNDIIIIIIIIIVAIQSTTHFVLIAWPPAPRGSMKIRRHCTWLVETTDLGFGLGTGCPVPPLGQVAYSCPHASRKEVHRRDSIL